MAAEGLAPGDDAPLPPDDQRRIARLIHRTARHGRFHLCIIEVRSPREGHAVEAWIREQMPDDLAVRRVDIGALPGENLWSEMGQVVGDDRPRGWVLVGLEEHGPEARRKRVMQLNVQRDILVRDFPGLWFLLVHPSLRMLLMQSAPDFVDYAVIWVRRGPPIEPGLAAAAPSPVPDWRSFERPSLSGAGQAIAEAIDRGALDEAEDRLGVLVLTSDGPESRAALDWLRAELRIRRGRIDEGLAEWAPGGAAFEATALEDRLGMLRRLARLLVQVGALDRALEVLRAWALPVCEGMGDEWERALTLGDVADILELRGEWDEALRIHREEALPVYERLGDVRSRAVTLGKIADILVQRGALDEALRMLREEALVAFDRLGDVRSRAVTLGRIADILEGRGALDEALRIRREEELPVYERLGDVRARAVTLGQIAAILFRRGALDEALRILREEVLVAFERLGDVRLRAVTLGTIADILVRRGALDEALRIRREEELPVFERLGDVRSRAVTLGRIAGILVRRGALDEALRILREEALPVYERLGDVRSRAVALGKIAVILFRRGELDEALRLFREEMLPVYERLGDAHGSMVTRANLALALHQRGDPADGPEIAELMARALSTARTQGYAEAEQIAALMRRMGLDDAATEAPDPPD